MPYCTQRFFRALQGHGITPIYSKINILRFGADRVGRGKNINVQGSIAREAGLRLATE